MTLYELFWYVIFPPVAALLILFGAFGGVMVLVRWDRKRR